MTAKMTPCGALHASSAIINSSNDIKHLILDSFISFFFCALAVVTHFAPIRFYKQTALRTEAFIYTEQLLRADILTQRGLRTKQLLCMDTFTHKGFYAKKERCHVQTCFCAHK